MHRKSGSSIGTRILLVAVAFASSGALAQGLTGSAVTGVVKDPSGGPTDGAAVSLKNTSTGHTQTATTGPTGKFFLDNVPPGGPYTLSVSSEGYQAVTREGIQLSLGQRFTADVEMKFAGEMISIEAHADALEDKARTGPSTSVREAAIARLPLQGRNFTDLIGTAPQVSGNSIAGQNNRLNNILIDGGANNDLFGLAGSGTPGGQANAKALSIEAIKEFVVQVAPFDVRQGSFVGGLVNAITKSGTNDFHGSVFGYNQNKNFAGYRGDPTFLSFNTWQFGASVGGPIVTDKAHFFAVGDFQQRQAAFGNQFQIGGVDSAADIARAGFDIGTAQRFMDILANKYGITNAGNALAPDLANPDRNVFLKLSTSVIENSDLELSYNFVKANQDVLGRAPTSTTVPGRLRDGYQLSGSGYGQANNTNTVRGKLTTNWNGGKLSNEFLAGISIIRDARDVSVQAPLILVKAGKLGSADAFLAAGQERFSQSNTLNQDIYSIQDNLTFALDNHRLTVGTSNEILNIKNVFLQAATGVWSFDSLDAFEAGTPSAYQRRFGVSDAQDPGAAAFRAAQLGLYVQDEWSILKNLVLTPGVRIDVPYLSRANRNEVLMNSATLPIDTSKVPSGNALLSPRVGLNWDIEGNSNTIVRGGTGVFSGRPAYVWVSNAYAVNGLSQVELTCTPKVGTTGTGVPVFTPDPRAQPSDCAGGTGKPTPPTNQGEIDYFDPSTKYQQNFRVALGADRRLPFDIVASADLLYTRDINGWYVTDENLVPQGQSGDGRSLYGSFTDKTFTTTASGSTINPSPTRLDTTNLRQAVKVFNKNGGEVYSGTLQLSKTFGALYAVNVGYTYSKSQDRMSLTSSQALSNFQFAPIDGDIQNRNVRPSAFDRPHKFTVTGTAALPYGFGVGVTYVGQSGTPYTWTVNGDVNGDGINGNDVAFVPAVSTDILLKDPTQYDALSKFIESQDCLREAKGSFIKRGACRNPWQNFLNTRFSWTSPEFKGQKAEVQLDIFNVLNLLNSDWGHFDEAAGFETHPSAFLKAVGYDTTANRPIYSFNPPAQVTNTVFSPTQSRWRMQLGARYIF